MNQSLETGTFPEGWKKGRIVPIHKGGEGSSLSNYRPVSILPAMSKVLEKIVDAQILVYLDDVNILPEGQHGFRENRSTFSALVNLFNKVSLYKDAGSSAILQFDLSAAFDTLDWSILLKKPGSLRL